MKLLTIKPNLHMGGTVNNLLKTFFVILFVLAGQNLFAQEAEKTEEKDKSPIVTSDPNPLLKGLVSLNAKDASMSEVLKVISDKSKMNFVAGSDVQSEKITIILRNTPVAEAIDLIVRAAGLSYEIIGNSVLIGKSDILKDETGQSGYVIALNYASAPEVAVMLGDFSKNVKVDKGGNRLIVYASPRVINEIERIVKSVDFPHIQILLETRIIEVSINDEQRTGIDWGAMSPISSNVSYPEGQLTAGMEAKGWVRGPIDLNITLDMLIQNGDARVLMNSKLTTTNNRPASMHIGERIPFVIQSYNTSANAGGAEQKELKHEEVGVKIKMLPHVNEDEEITIQIEPEVSSIAGYKGPDADLPLVKIRKTATTVRVRDGETVFLAGLLSEEETEEVRKLPVLGQIPLLGALFSHTFRVDKKTNLIIEVKPKIVKSPADLPGYKARQEREAKKEEEEKKSEESK